MKKVYLAATLFLLLTPPPVFAGPVFTEWYWTPLFFGILYGPWIFFGAIGLTAFIRPYSPDGSIFLLFIRILGITFIISFALLYLYKFYLSQRSGFLNPHTKYCIEHGNSGAKGDHCVK